MTGLLLTTTDYTLWNTQKLREEVQVGLFTKFEQLLEINTGLSDKRKAALIRHMDVALGMLNGKTWKYDYELFVQGLIALVKGATPKIAAEKAPTITDNKVDIDKWAFVYMARLFKWKPEPYDDVIPTFESLDANIMIISEGYQEKSSKITKTERLLRYTKLISYISVFYLGPKIFELYNSIYHTYKDLEPKIAVSYEKKDIQLYNKVGFTSVWRKPEVVPPWEDEIEVEPDYTIKEYKEIVDILMTV